jgi:group I intron endonuclease
MIGIYKITSPSKKTYIGQSINIQKRLKDYTNLQCKGQRAIYSSLLKYGVDKHKFEIVCECEISELNEKERYYQEFYNSFGKNGLNLTLTETKNKRKVHSELFRKTVIENNKKRVWTDESKKKIAEKQRIIMKGNSYKLGVKHNESFKQARSKIMMGNKITLGFKHTEQTKAKMSECSTIKKIVLDKQTGVFYNSINEVAVLYNLKNNTLAMKLKGYGNKRNNTQFILV